MAKKRDVLTTPKGIAVYPWLTKADTQFDEDGKYKTSLRLDPNAPGVAEFLSAIMDRVALHQNELKLTAAQLKKYYMPFENEQDDDGDETGMVLIKADTKAVWKDGNAKELRIFDAYKQPYEGGAIFGGSELRLNVSPAGFKNGKNIGLKLYLNAVQVISLVTGGGCPDGFDEEDGGYGAPAEGTPNSDSEDEIDF